MNSDFKISVVAKDTYGITFEENLGGEVRRISYEAAQFKEGAVKDWLESQGWASPKEAEEVRARLAELEHDAEAWRMVREMKACDLWIFGENEWAAQPDVDGISESGPTPQAAVRAAYEAWKGEKR